MSSDYLELYKANRPTRGRNFSLEEILAHELEEQDAKLHEANLRLLHAWQTLDIHAKVAYGMMYGVLYTSALIEMDEELLNDKSKHTTP